ncbi:hypothetical protein D0T23_02870 [Duganella sp. BJB475]|nr:hypothetical protein D0T23_02870 [Duganella sp. BJB475]RFP35415.1 hypothetical protein D0T21_02870 [Duganella sp. BJB476]
MLHNVSKLGRLACEVLNNSGELLERVLTYTREGIEESCKVSASLSMFLRRLEEGGGQLSGNSVSVDELMAATATARQLKLRTFETLVRVRWLVGVESISERYYWRGVNSDTTMIQQHASLAGLTRSAALAGGHRTSAEAEIRAIEHGIVAMSQVARRHRSVADRALLTMESLQAQAAQFVRLMEQAQLS